MTDEGSGWPCRALCASEPPATTLAYMYMYRPPHHEDNLQITTARNTQRQQRGQIRVTLDNTWVGGGAYIPPSHPAHYLPHPTSPKPQQLPPALTRKHPPAPEHQAGHPHTNTSTSTRTSPIRPQHPSCCPPAPIVPNPSTACPTPPTGTSLSPGATATTWPSTASPSARAARTTTAARTTERASQAIDSVQTDVVALQSPYWVNQGCVNT
ncbi:hypothetical protein N658DRAFT_132689 [Parathielavia hyrcaniae]|uniref:Uncharacterized protein n=1 Tax=Parathielavia hyrcaniae TaxID=113614 RepID=A0AAN6QCL8_9PEZI|nr:hypothetical protein N658DRAFT_132689 [Parathielavia hyrcaniae]